VHRESCRDSRSEAGLGGVYRSDVCADLCEPDRHRRQRHGHHGRLHAQQTTQYDHQQVHRIAGSRFAQGEVT